MIDDNNNDNNNDIYKKKLPQKNSANTVMKSVVHEEASHFNTKVKVRLSNMNRIIII